VPQLHWQTPCCRRINHPVQRCGAVGNMVTYKVSGHKLVSFASATPELFSSHLLSLTRWWSHAKLDATTTLVALGSLASEQVNPTQHTMEKCKQFLDYAVTQESAVIIYWKNNMVLVIHSDASYLSEPKAQGTQLSGRPLLYEWTR
jgi:hypothetical protein